MRRNQGLTTLDVARCSQFQASLQHIHHRTKLSPSVKKQGKTLHRSVKGMSGKSMRNSPADIKVRVVGGVEVFQVPERRFP